MQLIKKRKIASWLFDEVDASQPNVLSEIRHLPIHNITPNPYQPRRNFDEDALAELAESIRKYGVLQPITVRKLLNGTYELIAGERRLRACSLAGIRKIPAIVVELNDNDSAVVALVENIQRENLSFMEEAEAYRNLLYHHGLTQEELAASLGKTQSSVANKIRLLKLTRVIREIIKENNLTERHARALLRLDDEKLQIKALEKITDKGLNVRQTDELIEEMLARNAPEPVPFIIPTASRHSGTKDMRLFTNTLRHAIELIRRQGIEATSIETEYDDYIEYTITVPKEAREERIS